MLRRFPCPNLHPNSTIEGTEAHQHLQDVFFFHRLSTQCGFSKSLTVGEAQAPPNSYGLDADRTFYGPDSLLQQLDGRTQAGWEEDRWGSSFLSTPTEIFQHFNNWLNICTSANQLKVSLASGLWHVLPRPRPPPPPTPSPRPPRQHVSCDFLSWSLCQQLLPPRMPDLICLSKSDSKPPSLSPQQFICISLLTLGTFYL